MPFLPLSTVSIPFPPAACAASSSASRFAFSFVSRLSCALRSASRFAFGCCTSNACSSAFVFTFSGAGEAGAVLTAFYNEVFVRESVKMPVASFTSSGV